MATQTTTHYVDDIDGDEAAESISFALDRKAYEIDLSETNAAKFREALAPYLAGARKVRGNKMSTPKRANPVNPRTAKIREWARSRGYTVQDRGRINAEIVSAAVAAGVVDE